MSVVYGAASRKEKTNASDWMGNRPLWLQLDAKERMLHYCENLKRPFYAR